MPTATHIRKELEGILKQWKAGEEIRSLELGHTQQEEIQPDGSKRIADGITTQHDQAQVYEYAMRIIDLCLAEEVPDHETFMVLANEIAEGFRDLHPSAIAGAQSLAWKALIQGWKRAIDGHRDAAYIGVMKKQEANG